MKKRILSALIAAGIIVMIILAMKFGYPNVVTGIAPVKNLSDTAKAALDKVANAGNKDSALNEALNLLPDAHGETLEQRVAYWVGSDFKKIDSMKFALISGIGISATSAEKKVKEGFVRNQVIVKIFSEGNMEEYFLRCANGLVAKRWNNMVSETNIGETHVTESTTEVPTFITKGGSLFRDLRIESKDEALALAVQNNLKYWYGKAGYLYVLVHEGDQFVKKDGLWEYTPQQRRIVIPIIHVSN